MPPVHARGRFGKDFSRNDPYSYGRLYVYMKSRKPWRISIEALLRMGFEACAR